MTIKAKQTIFQVEPVAYPNEYNQNQLLPENMFKERLRFANRVESVFTMWPTTVRAWEAAPLAFGFLDYQYP